MKTVFTRREVNRLLDVLEWVNSATLASEEHREEIRVIAMKLKVALDNSPEDKEFEFCVEKV